MDVGPPGVLLSSANDMIVTPIKSTTLCSRRRPMYSFKAENAQSLWGNAPLVDIPRQPAEWMAARPLDALAHCLDVGAVIEVDDRHVVGDFLHHVVVQRFAPRLVERPISFFDPLVDLRVAVAH